MSDEQKNESDPLIDEYVDLLSVKKLSKDRIRTILELIYARGESSGLARARKIIEAL